MKFILLACGLVVAVGAGTASARPETLRLAATMGIDGLRSAAAIMTNAALCDAVHDTRFSEDKRLIAATEVSSRDAHCPQPHHARAPAI